MFIYLKAKPNQPKLQRPSKGQWSLLTIGGFRFPNVWHKEKEVEKSFSFFIYFYFIPPPPSSLFFSLDFKNGFSFCVEYRYFLFPLFSLLDLFWRIFPPIQISFKVLYLQCSTSARLFTQLHLIGFVPYKVTP